MASIHAQRDINADTVGLPIRPFLYTLDQIATMLVLSDASLRKKVHFEGRAPGARPARKMVARNIAADNETPEWRIAERELLRWLKVMGFRFYERGWGTA